MEAAARQPLHTTAVRLPSNPYCPPNPGAPMPAAFAGHPQAGHHLPVGVERPTLGVHLESAERLLRQPAGHRDAGRAAQVGELGGVASEGVGLAAAVALHVGEGGLETGERDTRLVATMPSAVSTPDTPCSSNTRPWAATPSRTSTPAGSAA